MNVQFKTAFEKLCEEKAKSNSAITSLDYRTAKLAMMDKDVEDVLYGRFGYSNVVKFYSSSDKGFDHLHLDDEGNVPVDNLVYYDTMIELAREYGLSLSYDVVPSDEIDGKNVVFTVQ